MSPRTGIAHLPLHGGSAPRWLFERMVLLARGVTCAIVEEYGPGEMLRRLSDPYWFQAFGCLLGFDWHSSGLTTVVCGALKEAMRGLERDTGLFIAGGKGGTSRRTPVEIEMAADRHSFQPDSLVYASRMAAKVDSAALQDGFQLYHHTFLWTPRGQWAVIQQGMNESTRRARRYHWLSEAVSSFVCEPHHGIISQGGAAVLNMVASEAEGCRSLSAAVACEPPERTLRELERLQTLDLPSHHHIHLADIRARRLEKAFLKLYERQPRDFQALLGTEGVGPKTVRALALISEVVHGTPASFRDPARYSFAHGGKDGHPYPVDRETYDRSIDILRRALERARLGHTEKLQAFRRLAAAAGM